MNSDVPFNHSARMNRLNTDDADYDYVDEDDDCEDEDEHADGAVVGEEEHE